MNEVHVIWLECFDERFSLEVSLEVFFTLEYTDKWGNILISVAGYNVYHGCAKITLNIDPDLVYDKVCRAIRHLEIEEDMK